MRYQGNKGLWVYPALLIFLIAAFFAPESNTDSLSEPADPIGQSQSPTPQATESIEPSASPTTSATKSSKALKALETLRVKGRAPKTGYSREAFSDSWKYFAGCDTRNRILIRDFESLDFQPGSICVVARGVLNDPYTGERIEFVRGVSTSLEVQIDHVVALSDAWQKGAQRLDSATRERFYNDPLNLLAVSGWTNSQKGDGDAATWLPPNRAFRCDYVARQVAVKVKYDLWVTQAEADAIRGILGNCPKQRLPKG